MSEINDPIDHAATARPRAGMIWRDRRQLLGLAQLLVAVLALVASMNAAAMRDAGWAAGFGVAALLLGVGGIGVILAERRRAVHSAPQHRR